MFFVALKFKSNFDFITILESVHTIRYFYRIGCFDKSVRPDCCSHDSRVSSFSMVSLLCSRVYDTTIWFFYRSTYRVNAHIYDVLSLAGHGKKNRSGKMTEPYSVNELLDVARYNLTCRNEDSFLRNRVNCSLKNVNR